MSTVDYGFFNALTGPLQSANNIQQNRDAERIRQLQLQEQEFQLQQRESLRQEQLNKQLSLASQDAHNEIFVNNAFKRDKDAVDYQKWYQNYSGFGDIQQILKQYSTMAQAMQDPRLKEAIDVYKQRVSTPSEDPTKGNPILFRAKQNFQALEQYKTYALDDKGYAKFLTSNSHQRFQDWQDGKTDRFIYTGVRGDYLNEIAKARDKSEKIDIDDVLYENEHSIATDMARDLNMPQGTRFSHQDMRSWLARELNYDASNQRFGDQVIFGKQEIDTDYATEVQTAIDATGKMGLRTGQDIFNLMDQGVSFKQIFDNEMSLNWDRLGGYDKNSGVHSTMRSKVSKSMEIMAGGRVLGNDRNLETALTNSWAGTYDDGKTPRYNSQNRQVYGVEMEGLYDRRGHKITDQDINSFLPEFLTVAQESERDNLRLTGYHIALEAKNKDGDSFLLTNVKSEDDMAKMREQYKDVVFTPVMVAELIDDDLGPDDAYYKKVEMGLPSVQAAINRNIDPEELNTTLNQMADYEQDVEQKSYQAKQKLARQAVLIKQMNLPDEATLGQVVSAYDQSLTIGLGTAGVPASKIQAAMPMIIADLYVNSQKQKEFPVVVESDPQGNPIKVANDAYELMAYRTQQLKIGLIRKNTGFEAMLQAIREGNYDAYRKSTMDKPTYNASKQLSKGISQYYNKR
jgi:hypothetical protein